MTTMSDKHYRARITKRVDLAPELWMIRIDPGAEFKFTPGQYATLGVEGEEKRSERPYSIASSPYENESSSSLELVPYGELTPQIHALKTGDGIAHPQSSKGRFVLDTASGRKNTFRLFCTW
jgi:ferredoxin--NADP+ reductase